METHAHFPNPNKVFPFLKLFFSYFIEQNGKEAAFEKVFAQISRCVKAFLKDILEENDS